MLAIGLAFGSSRAIRDANTVTLCSAPSDSLATDEGAVIASGVRESFYQSFPVLETAHLRLRELSPDDAHTVFEMFRDPEVTRFYDVVTMTDLEQARALTERLRRRFHDRNGIRWAIVRKDDSSMIGTCGYPVIAASANRGSIGYELARRAWGHGFATEAVEAITGFGHRVVQLHRIDAQVMISNPASGTVLRKCGFVAEGVLRDYALLNGRYHDIEIFAHLDHGTAGSREPHAAPT